MRLLYISNQRLPTEKAYGIQIAKMCEALAEQGVELELVVPYRQGTEDKDFFDYYGIQRNFTLTRVPAPDFYWPGFLDRFAVIIKQFISARRLIRHALSRKSDILFTRDEGVAYTAAGKGVSICFEAHTFSLRRTRYYRRFFRKGVRVVTINNRLREEFIKIGFADSNVFVAHDGVDLRDFDIDISQEEARTRLELPKDKKIAMYTGHLFAWKGTDTLAQATKLVEDVLFVFVGGTVPDVARFREHFGSQHNILIVGARPHSEMPLYMKAADVLVLPNSAKERISEFYTSPLKLFEYMAAKRPIVAAGLPSIREVLSDFNAVLVAPDDPQALARGIREILRDQNLANELSAAAYEKVKDHTWRQRAQWILEFIKS